MWATEDDFQYLWKKVSGDVTLTADITILTPTGDPHRKAALMIRRTLDKDSEYVDAALDGSGLTALQSRDEKGATTREVMSPVTGPTRLSLVKRGNYLYAATIYAATIHIMMVAGPGEQLQPAGGSLKLAINEPFYIGLAACAHNKDATVQATVENFAIDYKPGYTGPLPVPDNPIAEAVGVRIPSCASVSVTYKLGH